MARLFTTIFLCVISMNSYSFEKVFYCAYQIDDCVETPSPITKVIIEDLLPIIANGEKNFIGFVDSNDTTFQFYVDDVNKILVEIPVTKEKGSYSKHINEEEFYKLISTLKEPFIDYKKNLGLEYVAW